MCFCDNNRLFCAFKFKSDDFMRKSNGSADFIHPETCFRLFSSGMGSKENNI